MPRYLPSTAPRRPQPDASELHQQRLGHEELRPQPLQVSLPIHPKAPRVSWNSTWSRVMAASFDKSGAPGLSPVGLTPRLSLQRHPGVKGGSTIGYTTAALP